MDSKLAGKANTTAQQEFTLPLAAKYEANESIYWKNQFNVVHVRICFVPSADVVGGGTVLCTLPTGFRPKNNFSVGGVTKPTATGSSYVPCELRIYANGNVAYFGQTALKTDGRIFGEFLVVS